jgi:hypothetical protein
LRDFVSKRIFVLWLDFDLKTFALMYIICLTTERGTTVDFKKVFLIAAAAAIGAVSFAATLPTAIIVDQFGYRENAKKIAVAPMGPLTAVPGPFQVIDAATGEVVFEGPWTLFNGGQADAASGDQLLHFDFSSVTAPGRYYIRSGGIRSYTFSIGDGVYNNVLRAAVRTFYYQRAGIAKPAQYAGPEWADGMAFEQDRRSRFFFDSTNVALERDLSGGWFDAGDYNKYTKWTADYISEMFLMYEERPEAFTDDFGIPESGNGIPDIIDEAIWGLAWLMRMQNADGSMLSVQGLDHAGGNYNSGSASPPSGVTGRSYYGPPNATATFGAVRTFAIASRVLAERGYFTEYVDTLRAAAIRAWEWGAAHPDSMFSNNTPSNNSVGLAAGNQEIIDNEHTTGRLENQVTAAWFLYELTGDVALLEFVEANLKEFPLFRWGGTFMDHYRHSSHMLYIRYINDPRGNPVLKGEIRAALTAAFTRNDDFNSPAGYVTDGYRAFIKDYNWGSNKAKNDYGLTFYMWHTVDQSVDRREFRERAEGYLHYIHGVNPFNWVYLTNMERYGASRSQRTLYHTWFGENTRWSMVTDSTPGPAPGFMPGGPNARYGWDGCCPTGCWSAANNARCHLIDIPDRNTTPPARMYVETNLGWPINSWEITENMNAYQLSYIRLLSKFVDWSAPVTSIRPSSGRPSESKVSGIQYKRLRRGIELRVRNSADVRIFALNGAQVGKHKFTSGTHTISMARLPKGIYIVRMVVDGQTKDLRIPLAL